MAIVKHKYNDLSVLVDTALVRNLSETSCCAVTVNTSLEFISRYQQKIKHIHLGIHLVVLQNPVLLQSLIPLSARTSRISSS